MKKNYIPILWFTMAVLTGCIQEQYYDKTDFNKIEKIDAHVHINSTNPAFIEQAIADNFKLLTVNVDYPDFPTIYEQYRAALYHKDRYPEQVGFFATFTMQGWDNVNWLERTTAHLDSTFRSGALGVKFWKNIGMSFRDKESTLIMVNDQKLQSLFEFIIQKNKFVIHHQGEPRNCWLPVQEMSVNNDKLYFQNHPQYYMYLHPEYPSYEYLMARRDSVLIKNNDLKYMGAHLASLEWNVDTLAAFLDRFPGTVVDMAARMGQLQSQSIQNFKRVRTFLIKYSSRILYATDLTQPAGMDSLQWFREEAHNKWLQDWLYLTTDDTLRVPELDVPVRGLKLPQPVVRNIYHENARKLFMN